MTKTLTSQGLICQGPPSLMRTLLPTGWHFVEAWGSSGPDCPSLFVQSSMDWMRPPSCGLSRPYSRITRQRSSRSAMAEASSSSSRDPVSAAASYLPPFQGFQMETDPVFLQAGPGTPPDSKGLQPRAASPASPCQPLDWVRLRCQGEEMGFSLPHLCSCRGRP